MNAMFELSVLAFTLITAVVGFVICPWEAWGYAVQRASRPSVAGDSRLIWPNLAVIAVSIPFFAAAVALLLVAIVKVW